MRWLGRGNRKSVRVERDLDWHAGGGIRHVAAGARRDDDVGGCFDPVAIVVDATEGVNSADDGIGSRLDKGRAFDQVAESKSNVAIAALEEICCVRVTENRRAAHLVEIGDLAGRKPMDELVVDGIALRMPADGATTLVMRRAGAVVGSGLGTLPKVARLGLSPVGFAASGLLGPGALARECGGGNGTFRLHGGRWDGSASDHGGRRRFWRNGYGRLSS